MPRIVRVLNSYLFAGNGVKDIKYSAFDGVYLLLIPYGTHHRFTAGQCLVGINGFGFQKYLQGANPFTKFGMCNLSGHSLACCRFLLLGCHITKLRTCGVLAGYLRGSDHHFVGFNDMICPIGYNNACLMAYHTCWGIIMP